MFLAHIALHNGQRVEQSVADHVRNTARYAAERLASVGLYQTAYLAGLLHDLGKCQHKFANYLEDAFAGRPVVRGTVNHSFAAVIYLFEHFRSGKKQGYDTMTCELIACACGAHHGLFDCVDLGGKDGFAHRLARDRAELCYDEAVQVYLTECADAAELQTLFTKATAEVTARFNQARNDLKGGKEIAAQVRFMMGMTARTLLSAVIEGDRRDTAEFMHQLSLTAYYKDGDPVLWNRQLAFLEKKTGAFKADTPINQARARISDECRSFADTHGSGIYKITVPTGAGKTLATLRYALAHAAAFSKRRIIFIIPLLSILDQNEQVIRSYLADADLVFAHHSNVVRTEAPKDTLDPYELFAETWNKPVIISTLVQLLNNLFSGKTTAVRRMSALCDSVIVIDEIQSLPHKLVHLFNLAMNFLAYSCNATVVLSSATQPCLDSIDRFPLRLCRESPELVPAQQALFEVFKRTEIVDKTAPEGMTIDALADFSAEVLAHNSSLLVICNTKATALQLYTLLEPVCERSGIAIHHLSAAMCMAHRTNVLQAVREALAHNINIRNGAATGEIRKTLCIATQLVEAGVDFSFERVIRVSAGLDNLAQAVGRCNRSGEFHYPCRVYLVNLKNGAEKLRNLPDIVSAQNSTEQFLYNFLVQPDRFRHDMLSAESIAFFYRTLFDDPRVRKQLSYPVTLEGMQENLLGLLSDNPYAKLAEDRILYLTQPFQTVGQAFAVFDDDTTDLIVPYDQAARTLTADLQSDRAAHDFRFMQTCLEQAKRYTIHIFSYQKAKLEEDGMLYTGANGRILFLQPQCYSEKTGLNPDNITF